MTDQQRVWITSSSIRLDKPGAIPDDPATITPDNPDD